MRNNNILHRSMMGNIAPRTIQDYMTIEALEDGLTVKLTRNACEYCIDGSMEWIPLTADTATPAINTGQIISFKISNPSVSSSYGIGTFTISKKCNLSGNCLSLVYGDSARYFKVIKSSYQFYRLFRNITNIISVSDTFLPATVLGYYCYYDMFYGCTNLIKAPKLPAKILNLSCYNNMFYNCTSLTTAPELPATTLTDSCYSGMFYGCNSLNTAPALPATTLVQNCYRSMFSNCKNLINAPTLPATRAATSCYNNMFSNCTSLVNAPELPATTLSTYCYYQMFSGCTNLRNSPSLPATKMADYCYAYMFLNCSSLVASPTLPATTLADSCYKYMFSNCQSINTAPELPAITLKTGCYSYMFEKCSNLTNAPTLPATTLAGTCYDHMFSYSNVLPDCSNIDFTSNEVVASGGLRGLFAGTKVTNDDLTNILPLDSNEDYWLPVTTLTSNCYSQMFENCTNITKAPTLPAKTLPSYSYQEMFKGCSNLNNVRMFATDISATNCLVNWMNGVSSTGIFVKDIEMKTIPTGIPSAWEIVDNYIPQECVSLTISADNVSGRRTSTTIHWEATTNGVDFYNNPVNGIVLSGTATSEEFSQNTSYTDTVERTISFTYIGVTATTTIIQDVWKDVSYTVDLNNNWQLSTEITNPDSNVYEGVYESFSNQGKDNTAAIMYVDIVGYETFQLYIRSYAESSYDYVMVSQLDKTINNSSSYSDTTLVKAHTRASQNSGTTIGSYKLVEFTGIDGGEHRITIVYRKDSSSSNGTDRGYILIPKNQ